jgi:ribonucleotide reductase alpha subunit
MQVIKRDGTREEVSFDKVLLRVKICAGSKGDFTPLEVNPTLIAQRTLARIYDGVKTSELDELAAQLAISLVTTHPDYGTLAARIAISNHQRSICTSFSGSMRTLNTQVNPKTGTHMPYLSESFMAAVERFHTALDAAIKPERDFFLDYFGFKTLERQKYLLRGVDGVVHETPQYMWMRVALALWGEEALALAGEGKDDATALASVLNTYELLSQKYFIHATPTMFNAGSPRPQLSSCYLLSMSDDSIAGIYKTLADCAQISKYAGGIGIHIHNIRAKGAYIAGNGGTSTGIVPMLRNFNATARYVDQGSKRNGSFAIYLEPWHADVEDFLKLKMNTGTEEERARDLFYALWIPDLFMERVNANGQWTLFCPSEAPGLADVHGAEFNVLYEKYEKEGRGRRQVDAQKLWFKILDSQIETGTPYLLYKDAANAKSNQKNLGTIKSSNLCVAPETHILTDKGEFAIKTLCGKEVNVWNGKRWSPTTVMKTGDDAELITITIRDQRGYCNQITCTPYHKFLLQPADSKMPIADWPRIDANDLRPGMDLATWIDDADLTHMPRVVDVNRFGRRDATYCFNEPLNHAGVFNGVLTGNCTEIIEYSSPEETAVCNLASLALPAYVDSTTNTFDFAKLRDVTRTAVRNLNRVIDINFYPTPETKRSNMRHRPIGLGVQGLADVFAQLRLAWEDPAAAELNQRIFEHIYYAAVEASADQAALDTPYSSFAGSPASEGKLQFDLWNITPLTETDNTLDWAALKAKVTTHGLRNSLLLAPMPTASTSQILGYNECFEPITSNIYTRRTLSGEYIVVNKHLIRDLLKLGLWSEELKNLIIARNGSVQGIPQIPATLQALYKTAWELKQRTLIDMAADRGAFICQSQSLNLFVADPTYAKLTSMHFHAWRKGLKTGIYYLRTKAPVTAQKFTIDPELLREAQGAGAGAGAGASITAPDEGCVMCSS